METQQFVIIKIIFGSRLKFNEIQEPAKVATEVLVVANCRFKSDLRSSGPPNSRRAQSRKNARSALNSEPTWEVPQVVPAEAGDIGDIGDIPRNVFF